MTNLRCTADHHAVPPFNIRPVESGIIPDHFFNRLKNLSRSARPLRAGPTNPRCILDQHTLSPIKARSLPICPFFQSGRERGWSGIWCERAFRLLLWRFPHIMMALRHSEEKGKPFRRENALHKFNSNFSSNRKRVTSGIKLFNKEIALGGDYSSH